LNQEQTQQITAALGSKFGTVTLLSAESVGATIGSELVRNAFLAVAIALVLMGIYITFRFEWNFGVAAVLSLAQVVLFVCGVFSLMQFEINGAFIAAILTIIGYSINDTIVIFDQEHNADHEPFRQHGAYGVDAFDCAFGFRRINHQGFCTSYVDRLCLWCLFFHLHSQPHVL